jgi:hypothetical protein
VPAALGVARERTNAVEALEGEFGRDLRMPRDKGLVGRPQRDELEPQALRVLEPQPVRRVRAACPETVEAALPEVERLFRGDPKGDGVHHPRSRPPASRSGVLEEGDVGAGARVLVRVEQVVDGRVVLVDGLLDHPQPEDARVEVDVAGSVPGDARHVMDAVEPHASDSSIL